MLLLPLSLGPSSTHIRSAELADGGWRGEFGSIWEHENKLKLAFCLWVTGDLQKELASFVLELQCTPSPGLREAEVGGLVGAEGAAGHMLFVSHKAGQQVMGIYYSGTWCPGSYVQIWTLTIRVLWLLLCFCLLNPVQISPGQVSSRIMLGGEFWGIVLAYDRSFLSPTGGWSMV